MERRVGEGENYITFSLFFLLLSLVTPLQSYMGLCIHTVSSICMMNHSLFVIVIYLGRNLHYTVHMYIDQILGLSSGRKCPPFILLNLLTIVCNIPLISSWGGGSFTCFLLALFEVQEVII